MKKPEANKPNMWDTPVEDTLDSITHEVTKPVKAEVKAKTKAELSQLVEENAEPLYDLEGLMTDFPTAKELEKFLFDKTGVAVELKGRSNKFKYQTALDILEGRGIPKELTGGENPYLDKNDLIPVDEMKAIPPRPVEVHNEFLVNQFMTKTFPHPDADWKASGQKCDVIFRKYTNNIITYEILGPVAPRAVGTRVNKYGKEVPEKYTWVDPRTGEQVIRTASGMLTPLGTRLKNYMQTQKVNKSDAWAAWVDREFFIVDGGSSSLLDNPWGN
jgi:hypothetical protein